MSKKVSWLPAERVDIPDLVQGTHGFASQQQQHLFKNFILDNFCRIAEGFRVEIPNQATNPGEFTVFNGIAFDRSGQIINNEDEQNAAQSYTLLINGTYYIEVVYTSILSDVDVRAFMDSTFDNGNDVSGDPRIPGKEFTQGVTTRITPDWQIVTPVSTTDFDINVDPNSVKIPVAILTVAGGVVSSFSSTVPKSVLIKNAGIGDTELAVLNSRIMPDAFQITIDTGTVDVETINVTVNDRVNGILTLAVPLTIAHVRGARVEVSTAGAAEFLDERTDPELPTVGSNDARPRHFQGDETRGWVVAQDPYTVTGRSDLQISRDKDHIDFLAAQIRELKFGAEKDDQMGSVAPPLAFTAQPRYFERSGGLQGARTNTVSVGNGVDCWGDFNVSSYANAHDCIQAAHDALPAGGGIIYIKGSSTLYDITATSVLVTKKVKFIGDGSRTEIRATGAVAAIDINGSSKVVFENMHITSSGAATTDGALRVSSIINISIRDCLINGLVTNGVGRISGVIERSEFPIASVAVPISFNCFTLDLIANSCTFFNQVIFVNSSLNTTFSNCRITTFNPAASAVTTGTSCTGLKFINNVFYSNVAPAVEIGASSKFIDFDLCSVTSTAGFINAPGISYQNISVTNCDIIFIDNAVSAITIADGHGHRISGCTLTQTVNGAVTSTAIILGANDSTIDSCYFKNVDLGVMLIAGAAGNRVLNCVFDCDAGKGRLGIHLSNATLTIISGCEFFNLSSTLGNNVGVFIDNATELDITSCHFRTIGHVAGAVATIAGIYFSGIGSLVDLTVSECLFSSIEAQSGLTAWGICSNSSTVCTDIIINNNNFENIATTAGALGNAIRIDAENRIIISNNTITSVATQTSPADTSAIFIGNGSTLATEGSIVITGNVIQDVFTGFGAPGVAAIRVVKSGYKVNIANNNILINDSQVSGIWVDGLGAAPPITSLINISNNVIEGNGVGVMDRAIMVDFGDTGEIVVSGNIIREYSSYGIRIVGPGAVNVGHVNVNSNNLFTSATTPSPGIDLTGIAVFTVCNNTVFIGGVAGARTCINIGGVGTTTGGTIIGNSMSDVNSTTARLNLVGTLNRVAVSGNNFIMSGVEGIRFTGAIDRIYVTGNVFSGNSAYPIQNWGATTNSTSVTQDDSTAPSINTPGNLGNTGLNLWQ